MATKLIVEETRELRSMLQDLAARVKVLEARSAPSLSSKLVASAAELTGRTKGNPK